MTNESIEMLKHIFTARSDKADSIEEAQSWQSAKDCLLYALDNNLECLAQFDYLSTDYEDTISRRRPDEGKTCEGCPYFYTDSRNIYPVCHYNGPENDAPCNAEVEEISDRLEIWED